MSISMRLFARTLSLITLLLLSACSHNAAKNEPSEEMRQPSSMLSRFLSWVRPTKIEAPKAEAAKTEEAKFDAEKYKYDFRNWQLEQRKSGRGEVPCKEALTEFGLLVVRADRWKNPEATLSKFEHFVHPEDIYRRQTPEADGDRKIIDVGMMISYMDGELPVSAMIFTSETIQLNTETCEIRTFPYVHEKIKEYQDAIRAGNADT